MSHQKFEHPRHGSLGFLPRKRCSWHRGKGTLARHLPNSSRFYALFVCRVDQLGELACYDGYLCDAMIHVVAVGRNLIMLVPTVLCTSMLVYRNSRNNLV
jgi:hypothetical protein